MANQANLIDEIQSQKETLAVKSWVYLKGKKRKRYIELCRLQRNIIIGKLTNKEIENVLDKR